MLCAPAIRLGTLFEVIIQSYSYFWCGWSFLVQASTKFVEYDK